MYSEDSGESSLASDRSTFQAQNHSGENSSAQPCVIHVQPNHSTLRTSVHFKSASETGKDETSTIGLLEKLEKSIKENTKMLRKIEEWNKHVESDEEEKYQTTKQKLVEVQIKITFLRIIDVDTVHQSYKADVFLQAKWFEPKLQALREKLIRGMTHNPLGEIDGIKGQDYWDPKLVIINADGGPEEDYIWHRAKFDPLLNTPMMIYRRRMRCRFKENLELKHFPVDVQELTIQVSSNRKSSELVLVEDQREISSVVQGLNDSNEWELYSHVVTPEEVEGYIRTRTEEDADVETDARHDHPKFDLMCHVGRRPWYYFWNVIFIMMLINLLTFTIFAISPDAPHNRLGVTLTLLLTAVAFKSVVARTLPRISYLTYLDIYVLISIVFLSLQAVQSAIVSILGATAKEFDFYYMISVACALGLFHVIFFLKLCIQVLNERRKLRNIEALYENKKANMAKEMRKFPTITDVKDGGTPSLYHYNDNLRNHSNKDRV